MRRCSSRAVATADDCLLRIASHFPLLVDPRHYFLRYKIYELRIVLQFLYAGTRRIANEYRNHRRQLPSVNQVVENRRYRNPVLVSKAIKEHKQVVLTLCPLVARRRIHPNGPLVGENCALEPMPFDSAIWNASLLCNPFWVLTSGHAR